MMLVTLADKSAPGGTVQPPGRGEGSDPGNTASNNEAAGLPGRNFIESWPLDLSAFLAGEDSVTVHAGDPCVKQDTTSSRNTSPQERTLVSKRFAAAAAPEGLRYMRLSVSLRGAGIASGGTALASEEGTSRPDGRSTRSNSFRGRRWIGSSPAPQHRKNLCLGCTTQEQTLEWARWVLKYIYIFGGIDWFRLVS